MSNCLTAVCSNSCCFFLEIIAGLAVMSVCDLFLFWSGYGGGFMERDEVVEYVERNDSDDEYDEVIDFYVHSCDNQMFIVQLVYYLFLDWTVKDGFSLSLWLFLLKVK